MFIATTWRPSRVGRKNGTAPKGLYLLNLYDGGRPLTVSQRPSANPEKRWKAFRVSMAMSWSSPPRSRQIAEAATALAPSATAAADAKRNGLAINGSAPP